MAESIRTSSTSSRGSRSSFFINYPGSSGSSRGPPVLTCSEDAKTSTSGYLTTTSTKRPGLTWSLVPTFFLFVPQNTELLEEYELGLERAGDHERERRAGPWVRDYA